MGQKSRTSPQLVRKSTRISLEAFKVDAAFYALHVASIPALLAVGPRDYFCLPNMLYAGPSGRAV